MTVSAEPEPHADFAWNRSHRTAGNAEDAALLFFPAVPELVLRFREFLRTPAGAEHNTDLPLLLYRHSTDVETRVLHSLGCCCHAERHYPRNVFAFASVNPGEFVELWNFSGDMHGKVRG